MPDNNSRQLTPTFGGGSFGVSGPIGNIGSFAITANNHAQLAASLALASTQATALGDFALAASLAYAANFHTGQAASAYAAAAALGPFQFGFSSP